jgi:protoporphyrinogen oxidase
MKSETAVVVGGGVVGIVASILLSEKFSKVLLIEGADACGGLLKTVQDDAGVHYDIGTHFPGTTNEEGLDQLLFGSAEEMERDYNTFSELRTGSYFNGKWNPENPTVDARFLPEDLYRSGVSELLEIDNDSEAPDLLTFLYETIGPTFTDHIALPVVKKLYGIDPSKLSSRSSVGYFGVNRLIMLNSSVTNQLKKLPVYDKKLGFHTARDHQDYLKETQAKRQLYLYPKDNKGVSLWVDRLLEKARDAGVQIMTSARITKILHENQRIKGLMLQSMDAPIECDFVCWTIPVAMALRLADIKVETPPPQLKTAAIFHYSYDSGLVNRQHHYVWNWDPTFHSFRITLYQNMMSNCDIGGKLSAEVLTDPQTADQLTLEEIDGEIRRMGLVSIDAKVTSALKQVIHNTFPIPSLDFAENTKKINAAASKQFGNMMVAGRNSGDLWFQGDVLRDIYTKVNAL